MTTKVTSSVLANTAVTAGNYGAATIQTVIAVDAQGRITSAANVTSSVANTNIIGLVIDSQIATVSNTKITGLITSGQIASVANTQITGLITSGQIASVANTQITGTIAPAQIQTASSYQVGSFGVGTPASGTTGEIRATNNITAYFSDERLKKKLGSIENALDKLCSLEGFYYEANELAQSLGYDPVREVGISAQQVQQVLPEIVAPAPIDEKYLTVRYERALPLIIEAIKELKQEIDELKKLI